MRKLMILATFATTAGGLALAACAPVEGGGGATASGDAPDQCKAAQYQSYIGRNRSELPRQPDGERWRVTCTTCPMTMDYNPSRLNILYDEQTGIIRKMNCG